MDRQGSRSRERRSRSRSREAPQAKDHRAAEQQQEAVEEKSQEGAKQTIDLKYVDRKDDMASEDRRAGMSHKPAWMTRGIGVNKEVFGETKGDLMKPGLTQSDLERIEKQVPQGPDPFGDVFKEAKEEKSQSSALPSPASASAGSSFRSTAPLPSQDELFGGKRPLPPQSAAFGGIRPGGALRPGCLGFAAGPCGFGAGKGGFGFGQMLQGMMPGGCGGCGGCGACAGKGFGGGCKGFCGGGCKGGGCGACLGGFGSCGGFGPCGGAGPCQGGCGGCGGCGGGIGLSGGAGGCQGGCCGGCNAPGSGCGPQ